MLKNKRVLIVDDEDSIRFGMRGFLEAQGYEVVEADCVQKAKEVFESSRPDVAVLDYRLPDGDAMDLLRVFKQVDPEVPLVVLTAYASIELAVQVVKEGAEQFLTKPIDLPSLSIILQRLLESRRIQRKQQATASREVRDRIDPFLGTSPAIQELADHARKVMQTESPILLLGETGTGKSVLAAWLHRNGPRAADPFVDLNCAGLSREFLETELFGHQKGAISGAVANKQGLLEVAHGGTVFLDEIGDIDPQVQPKLLKVLEERRFRRLGEVLEREVDITLIAATSRDIDAMVKQGTFRSDLYFRVSTIPLTIPPLRERRGDIVLLARRLLTRIAADLARGEIGLSRDAEEVLTGYHWPGNLRELRNALERAALLCDERVITRRDLSLKPVTAVEDSADGACDTLQEVERRHIQRVLRQEQGKVEQAAVRLGIPRSSLYQKIKTYGITISKS